MNKTARFIIREAIEADLPELLDIHNNAVINTTAVYDYSPRAMEAQKIWFQNKQRELYPLLIAEYEGKAVGYCSYGPFRAWPAYSRTVEWSVYVNLEYREQGVANQLLLQLIEKAKLQEFHTIIAGIDATNEPSIRLHKKLGFVHVGQLREVGWKFDRWLDLAFMQLILS